jgi:hypothetical protein
VPAPVIRDTQGPVLAELRSRFKMHRFESSRTGLEVWASCYPRCRSSNPAAPASQSGLQASHMDIAKKARGAARFRRYEPVSECGIWQWRRHSCLLSPRTYFGVSFLMCDPFGSSGDPNNGQPRTLASPPVRTTTPRPFIGSAGAGLRRPRRKRSHAMARARMVRAKRQPWPAISSKPITATQ